MAFQREAIFATLFLIGVLGAGFCVTFFSPVFALLLPFLTLPVFAYGFYQYRMKKGRESRLSELEEDGVIRLGAKAGEISRLESDANKVEGPVAEVAPQGLRWKNVSSLMSQQIKEITARDLPKLEESLPADGVSREDWNILNGVDWVYQYHFQAVSAEFNAVGIGRTPRAAFEMAKRVILMQVREWHEARAKNEPYIGHANDPWQAPLAGSTLFSGSSTKYANRKPTVLIVEDDRDLAEATATVFKNLNCETLISNGRDGAPQKMSFDQVDFIVLDWILGADLHADQLLNRSERIINTFRDLQNRFQAKNAKIITFSALDRSEIHLPETRYFEHLDHWQKPVPIKDLQRRAEKILQANGF